MLALRESEGVRPRHPLPRPAEHAGPSSSSFANLQTFQHSNFLTLSRAIPFRIRTYKKHACNSFGIRTSKTQDLKPFRMNTYKKTPRGEGSPETVRITTKLSIDRPLTPAMMHSLNARPIIRMICATK
jgi:hypothetical protein